MPRVGSAGCRGGKSTQSAAWLPLAWKQAEERVELIMWEYKVIEMITLEPMAIERRLNELGHVNWELVSYFFSDSGASGMAVFKRPGRRPDRRASVSDRRKVER